FFSTGYPRLVLGNWPNLHLKMAKISLSGPSMAAGVDTGIDTANDPVATRQLLISPSLVAESLNILGICGGGATRAACLVVQRLTTAVNSCPATTPSGSSTV